MVTVDASALIHLRTSQRAVVPLDEAAKALRAADLGWLGVPASAMGSHSSRRTFRCDLRLPVHAIGHDVEFRKAAIVELGPLREGAGQLSLDITWRSATLSPLFPVFAGRLTVTGDRIEVDGWYAPPGGRIGVTIDRALLGIAARRTAAWFLRLVAETLGSAPARAEQQQHAEHDDRHRPQRLRLRVLEGREAGGLTRRLADRVLGEDHPPEVEQREQQ
jgi:hypothetical protein